MMLDSIKEAIQKNLPAAVGEELRQFISDAEATKRRAEMLQAAGESKDKEVKRLTEEVNSLQLKVKAAGEMDVREKAVMDRENKLAVTLAELKVHEAEARASQVKELFTLVFKNPRLMRTLSESESYPLPPRNPGDYPVMATKSKSTTETSEQQ